VGGSFAESETAVTDPAVEAARRAGMTEFPPRSRVLAAAAAREALAPLRELHRRLEIAATSCPEECEVHEDECPLDVMVPACRECFRVAETADCYFTERTGWDEVARWPCPTARLIYREDEL